MQFLVPALYYTVLQSPLGVLGKPLLLYEAHHFEIN